VRAAYRRSLLRPDVSQLLGRNRFSQGAAVSFERGNKNYASGASRDVNPASRRLSGGSAIKS